MTIHIEEGDPFFYTEEFKVIVRSCREMIKAKAKYVQFGDPSMKYAHRTNFYRLIRSQVEIGVPLVTNDMMWVTQFINGIENPYSDISHLDGIWIIDRDVIQSFIMTTRVIRQ